ncbi:MAG: hypothetical protein EA425_10000 [Puniceicoccaceae bacterium]|nr:MAG: hypothetical protein EA425_10000 [Puniceicoccaceae bacterium]
MSKAAKVEMPCGGEAVKAKTGRDWAEWGRVLDEAGAKQLSHADIAKLVDSRQPAGGWWSQQVTVGYERMRGLRAPGEAKGKGFTASASKTLAIPAAAAHDWWTDAARRRRWLDTEVEITTATAPKSVRLKLADETRVQVWITAASEAKSRVGVEHTGLADAAAREAAKAFWSSALALLKTAAEGG